MIRSNKIYMLLIDLIIFDPFYVRIFLRQQFSFNYVIKYNCIKLYYTIIILNYIFNLYWETRRKRSSLKFIER